MPSATMPHIYLDHMTSTPIDEVVLEAMLPWLRSPGNPHARHDLGHLAHEAVERARGQIASLIGADRTSRIVFTSGATEATNIALRGLELKPGSRCVTSTIEHSCVRETLADLTGGGVVTTEIVVGSDGIVDLDALSAAIAEEPADRRRGPRAHTPGSGTFGAAAARHVPRIIGANRSALRPAHHASDKSSVGAPREHGR